MVRVLPITAAFGLLLLSGLVHGVWTSRWWPSRELEEAAARLERVPLDAGDWKGSAVAVDPDMYQRAGAVTYWARRYVKRDQAIMVILMCGPVGKMAVHTPEVCYQGAGYEMTGAPTTQAVRTRSGGPGDECWTARFRKPESAGGTSLRLFWSWNATGSWQAPDWPRWTFRGEPFLYKLYVVRELGADNDRPEVDASLDLLRQLLPVLDQALFSPTEKGSS